MTSILLIAIGVFAVAAATTVSAVMITATRPAVETSVVSSFGEVGVGCPAADTLAAFGTETVLPERKTGGDWRVTTLHSLADVESFMDYLENHNVTEREMHILTSNSFAVRWRAAA
jgi:hypothetical protein